MFEEMATVLNDFFKGPVLKVGNTSIPYNIAQYMMRINNDIAINGKCYGQKIKNCYLITHDDKEKNCNYVKTAQFFLDGELVKVFTFPLYASIKDANPDMFMAHIALASLLITTSVIDPDMIKYSNSIISNDINDSVNNIIRYTPTVLFCNTVYNTVGFKYSANKLRTIFRSLENTSLNLKIDDRMIFGHNYSQFFLSEKEFKSIYDLFENTPEELISIKDKKNPIVYGLLDCNLADCYLSNIDE